MIEYHLSTRVGGLLAITSDFRGNRELQQNGTLYKFIWVQNGQLGLEIDHVKTTLQADEIISLTPLHHVTIDSVEGEYITLLFNSNFYCIFDHDNEVSCNGFLFHGSSNVMTLKLTGEQTDMLCSTLKEFIAETRITDKLQEEMLRIMLKRFIIICTRIAFKHYGIDENSEKAFDVARRFHVLVDNNFKEKKRVQDYADMLFRSPKTLSNLFAAYDLPSPLRIIHERLVSEAKRLLIYTDKNAKEIGDILGFEDLATFSRFFKKMTGKSISEFRKENV